MLVEFIGYIGDRIQEICHYLSSLDISVNFLSNPRLRDNERLHEYKSPAQFFESISSNRISSSTNTIDGFVEEDNNNNSQNVGDIDPENIIKIHTVTPVCDEEKLYIFTECFHKFSLDSHLRGNDRSINKIL